MKKRLPALLLTFALLFTLVPAAVNADNFTEPGDSEAYVETDIMVTSERGSPFTDVQDSSTYYYEPVLWASDRAIVYGMTDTTFAPNAACTRAQVVTFLYRAAGKPEITEQTNPFTDVHPDDYYYNAVLWGYQNQIVYGVTDTTFAPGTQVTRSEFITFLYRFAGSPETTGICPFKDVLRSSWYYDAVLWGYRNQIVYGISKDTFAPNNVCSRAQVVTFLYRFYNEASAPTEPDTISALYEQIDEMVSGYSGTWSVYFERLDTGEHFAIHDTPMVSASLIKLYVYGAAAQQAEEGKLSYAVYSNSMQFMISASDNTACNVLVDAVGGTSVVNDFIRSQAWTDTVMNRKMLQAGAENYTSVSECGDLLKRVYDRTYVSSSVSESLLNAMLNQYRRTKIPAGIPYGTRCADKTGELTDVENDAAIVYSPACDYILVVMSDDISAVTAQEEIRSISGTVYNYLNTAQ